jgi:molybdate transport system substrate-binding protein
VAAAADLKFALSEIVAAFGQVYPAGRIELVYGSSGKLHTQIRQGAPYDLFLSADIDYPRALIGEGLAASAVRPYGLGRIVLWGPGLDGERASLEDLLDPAVTRIAIANPRHAPYGQRAQEALRAAGLWGRVESRLVYGENVAQAAQFAQTGNAQVAIIALSLALNPELSGKGGHWTIPDHLHRPLEQGYIVTRHAADNPLAWRFAEYLAGAPARAILSRYGFLPPGEPAGR